MKQFLLFFALLTASVVAQEPPVYNALVAPTVTADNINASTFNDVKVYRALMTQTGTSAPAPIVLSNSIGSITWARSSAGVYTGTLTGAFPVGRVFMQSGIINPNTGSAYYLQHTDTSTVTLLTKSAIIGGTAADNMMLTSTPIEIRVYP